MTERVSYFLEQQNEPTIIAESLVINWIEEFHLMSGINLRPKRHSKYGASLRVESFMMTGEKLWIWSMMMKQYQIGFWGWENYKPVISRCSFNNVSKMISFLLGSKELRLLPLLNILFNWINRIIFNLELIPSHEKRRVSMKYCPLWMNRHLNMSLWKSFNYFYQI